MHEPDKALDKIVEIVALTVVVLSLVGFFFKVVFL